MGMMSFQSGKNAGSNSNLSSADSQHLFNDTQMKELVAKKANQIQLAYDRKVRELKPYLFDKACQFLKEQTAHVTQIVTKQHHFLLQQFLHYKDRSDDQIKKFEELKRVVGMLELAVAQKTPVMEAEYAIDDTNKLSLFDCLIPKLKENRRFKIQKDEVFSIADFKTQQRVKQLEWELEQQRLPLMKEQNYQLKMKIKYYENELQIVKWYTQVLEDGIDTRKVI